MSEPYYEDPLSGGGLLQQQHRLANAASNAYRLSITERTRMEIQHLEEQLKRKRELLVLLDANPDFNRILDLMG